MSQKRIVILGIFVADTAYRAKRQPKMGETLLGRDFNLGPGGKGSNQAVAAARLGSAVSFISRLGDDEFANMARRMWKAEAIEPLVISDAASFTGAAYIFVDDTTGDNAIIVVPGAASNVAPTDLDRNRHRIEEAAIFMTQLETPVEAAKRGLEIAKSADVTTVLNPAPAAPLDRELLELCDYLTPNESEASILTGFPIRSIPEARSAAEELRDRGANSVIITLGKHGAYFHNGSQSVHVEAYDAGKVVETTGAGDSFNGAFVHGLLQGLSPVESTRFACVAASISVTRPGTAPSMPTSFEVEQIYGRI